MRTAVCAGTDAAGVPIHEDMLFPVASATKLATALAALRLVERGSLDLDAPLAQYLPRACAAQDGVTPRSLLNHTSGLPLDVHPTSVRYAHGLTWRSLAETCLATPLASAPGAMVRYSNVGYGLLALIIEQLVDADFATALEQLVLAPLGIEAYFGREPARAPAVIAGIDSPHAGTDLEPLNSAFWRALALPWGGLVTTGAGLLALLAVYADSRPDLLGPCMTAEARADQSRGMLKGGFVDTRPFLGFNDSRPITWPRCAWGLGVEVRGKKWPHWTPSKAPPQSFGHIAASGCLAWCAPALGTSWAILSPQTTDNGWLLRHGPGVGAEILASG